jgi:hypothetical protein
LSRFFNCLYYYAKKTFRQKYKEAYEVSNSFQTGKRNYGKKFNRSVQEISCSGVQRFDASMRKAVL